MKYYTKEWYALMQKINVTDCYEPIPDKVYTDRDIRILYDQQLKAEIENDRLAYDTPPCLSPEDLFGDEKAFDPEDFLFEDPETGRFYHPRTLAEAKSTVEKYHREQMEAFERRMPFDSAQTQAFFEDNYKYMLEDDFHDLPFRVMEKVDKRLLALNLLPRSIYDEVAQEEAVIIEKFEAVNEEAEEVLGSQDIPDAIKDLFYFHDAMFISVTQEGADIDFILRVDGIWDAAPFVKIRFKKITRLDREDGFVINLLTDEDDKLYSSTYYLYEELYKTSAGYEAHFLVSSEDNLKYLTITCENIEIEEGIDLGDKSSF
ncbi:MAG: DUF4085 family protein [Saccharofermentanales bacterium]|jgi:hypothetical protein